MNIITISREFGSGGREVGKRLADALGYGYYDREILTAMAQSTEMEESYLEQILERGAASSMRCTARISRSKRQRQKSR